MAIRTMYDGYPQWHYKKRDFYGVFGRRDIEAREKVAREREKKVLIFLVWHIKEIRKREQI